MPKNPSTAHRAARVRLPRPSLVSAENPPESSDPPPPLPPSLAPSEPGPDTDPPIARLSLPLTADGRVAADKLRDRTKDALRRALSDPGLSAAIGMNGSAAPASEADAMIMAQLSNALFDSISAVAVLTARRAGYEVEHAGVLAFTRDEKQQFEPLAARVINKYLPRGGKYDDEIVLAFAVANAMAGKIMVMRHAAATGSSVLQPSSVTGQPS